MEREIKIFEVNEARTEYAEAINRLLPQLSSTPHALKVEQLRQLISHSGTHLFLLQADEVIGAMLTLCVTHCPTGCKMWIEDVVVDKSLRGQSLGRMIVEHAIEYARRQGNATVMLTSRPSRIEANALYRSTGFTQRDTNVYKQKV